MTSSITSYDTDFHRESLISFLSQTDEFKNYNFDGSALKEIIRLLTFDSQQSALHLNFLANELNLDSASIRANVVSGASREGYLPRSKTAAKIKVDVIVRARGDNPATTIKLTRNHRFITRNTSDDVVTFSPMEEMTATINDDGVYEFIDILLVQGTWQYKSYEVISAYAIEDYMIPHEDVDTSTLQVAVKDNIDSTNYTTFRKFRWAHDLALGENVYFLSCQRTNKYHVEFGDGILSDKVERGNIVYLSYVVTSGGDGNGIYDLTASTPISGETDITVRWSDPSFGGADEESIESIKLFAPKLGATRGRCVSDTDYEVMTHQIFPQAQSVRAWGGEKATPPNYGYTYLSVVLDNNELMSTDAKNYLVDELKKLNVGAITPLIVDPNITYFDLVIGADIRTNRSLLTIDEYKINIGDKVRALSAIELERFGHKFDASSVMSLVKGIDDNISAVSVSYLLRKNITVQISIPQNVNIEFDSKIEPATVLVSGFGVTDVKSADHTYIIADDGEGNLHMNRVGEFPATLQSNIGTVDYVSGSIAIDNFLINQITSIGGSVSCSVRQPSEVFPPNLVNNSIHAIGTVTVEAKEII